MCECPQVIEIRKQRKAVLAGRFLQTASPIIDVILDTGAAQKQWTGVQREPYVLHSAIKITHSAPENTPLDLCFSQAGPGCGLIKGLYKLCQIWAFVSAAPGQPRTGVHAS